MAIRAPCPVRVKYHWSTHPVQAATEQSIVRTVRLDDAQIGEILDRMDALSGADRHHERRMERYPYRVKGVVVHLQQPGSTAMTPYLVPTRNISAGGLAFLHGGYVHVHSTCLAQLITTMGGWKKIAGQVVGCRHVQGTLHEVRVRFDHEIDVSQYAASGTQIRALVADDDASMARLACFHLTQLNAHVDAVTNGRDAVAKALAGAYDVILMDMEMPVQDGFSAVRELRERGYTGIIIAVTSLTQPEDQQRCIEAGCNRCVSKPYAREEIVDLIANVRVEPIYSTLEDNPAFIPLISDFLRDLARAVRLAEQALQKSDAPAITVMMRDLKAKGAAYGFGSISLRASQIEVALLGGAPLAEVRQDVEGLLQVCRAARLRDRTSTNN